MQLTSGVSAGQIMPHSVLCSCRGRASFPSRPTGELRRRRWDNVEANVSLFNTCDTPARAWWAFFWSPQLPVASEYLRPSVMIRVLMANSRLKSFPRSMNFWAYMRTSLFKLRNRLQSENYIVQNHQVNGSVEECSNSSAIAVELLQSCRKPSMCLSTRYLALTSYRVPIWSIFEELAVKYQCLCYKASEPKFS